MSKNFAQAFSKGLMCGFGLFFLLAIYGALKQAAKIDERNGKFLRRMSELADKEMQEHAARAPQKEDLRSGGETDDSC